MAIVGGLGAALVFATATLSASRSARLIGAWSAVGWVMLVGLALVLPPVVAGGVPAKLNPFAVRWLAVSGVTNVAGLLLAYTALRGGKVGLVAPIVSTEGALAAVISVLAGQTMPLSTGVTLAVITVGVLLATSAPEDPRSSPPRTDRRAPLWALAAAAGFGSASTQWGE